MNMPRDAAAALLLRQAVIPFLALMVLVSIWDQRVFFALMGSWSIFLIAYPLRRGQCVREDILVLSALLLALPFAVYAADLALRPAWGSLTWVSEVMTAFMVGLFTFVHLISFHGMRLDRLSLSLLSFVSTVGMGMLMVLGQYLGNILFGTAFIYDNDGLMMSLAALFAASLALSTAMHVNLARRGVGIISSLEGDTCERRGP